MGQGTFVNQAQPPASTASGAPRPLKLRFDVPFLLIIAMLLVVGLLMVYSASWDYSMVNFKGDESYVIKRQLMWAGLGILVAAGLSMFDYHRFKRLVVPMMMGTLILLVIVLIANNVRLGAVRSLVGGSGQPSELAKIVIIIYLAFWLYSKREVLNDISFGLVPMAAILGITGGLILMQPDLSAAATVIVMGGLMFILAGADWKQIVGVFLVSLLLGFILINISHTGRSRIDDYIAGLRDPEQASYHVRRSLEAVVNGGWFGVGIGQANTKFTGLPVPPTDSIFAVIAEETGILGASGVVLLYMAFLWRGLTIAKRAADPLGSLLAGGLTLWVTMEALINMAVIMGILPFAGNALPFMSAGGSNMLVTLASCGIIMNVARGSVEKESEEGRSFGAVVDLRRRNGRRRVSGARRSAGIRL